MRGLKGRGPGQLKNRSEWEVWAFFGEEEGGGVCGGGGDENRVRY